MSVAVAFVVEIDAVGKTLRGWYRLMLLSAIIDIFVC